MANMTRAELAQEVGERTNTDPDLVQAIILRTMEAIRDQVAEGGVVRLYGIGCFELGTGRQRYYDPNAGQMVDRPPNEFVRFRPGTRMCFTPGSRITPEKERK